MSKYVLITLTSVGSSNGNSFNLFSDVDNYATPFESNVLKSYLLTGYTSLVVPDSTTKIKVQSVTGGCGLQPDNGISIQAMTPTPTPTNTVTPTVTPTNTITPTTTATPTNTVTPTVTVTNTVTPTVTPSVTATSVTPTLTPTSTVTPTVTPTSQPLTMTYNFNSSYQSGTANTNVNGTLSCGSCNTVINGTSSGGSPSQSRSTTTTSFSCGSVTDITVQRSISKSGSGTLPSLTSCTVTLTINSVLIDTQSVNNPGNASRTFTFSGLTINAGDNIVAQWSDFGN